MASRQILLASRTILTAAFAAAGPFGAHAIGSSSRPLLARRAARRAARVLAAWLILLTSMSGRAAAADFADTQRACDKGEASACVEVAMAYASGDALTADTAKAAKLFRRGCEAGEAKGCNGLGVLALSGNGVTKDEKKAVSLFRKACASGYSSGCLNLGLCEEAGDGVSPDLSEAQQHYSRACDLGSAEGCSNSGWAYLTGRGVASDASLGIGFLARACDTDPSVCVDIGTLFMQGADHLQADVTRAGVAFDRGCGSGVAEACFALGHMWLDGEGTAHDRGLAKQAFERGCALGDQQVCSDLAFVLAGDAGPGDAERARVMWDSACEAGIGLACANLATALDSTVEADVVQASALLERGCSLAYGPACTERGRRFTVGGGIVVDLPQAASYFVLGCLAGDAAGCAEAGSAYSAGNGVEQDSARAFAYLRQGCDGRSGKACEGLGGLYSTGLGVHADPEMGAKFFDVGCQYGDQACCLQLKLYEMTKPGP